MAHNLMMSYRALRPSDPELLSNIASNYGHMNGNMFPLEYYNTIKSLQQSSAALPLPIKPTALSAISFINNQEQTTLRIPRSNTPDIDKVTSDKLKDKPVLGHSVDALLRPSKVCSSEKVLDRSLESVNVHV